MTPQEQQAISDEQDLLTWNAEIVVVVVGRDKDFLLIPIKPPRDTREVEEEARARGFSFAGVVGWSNGRTNSKCSHPDSLVTMASAIPAFAQFVAETRGTNSAEWLTRLYQLPDPRED